MNVNRKAVLELIEKKRLQVVNNLDDPSWTEHFAELATQVESLERGKGALELAGGWMNSISETPVEEPSNCRCAKCQLLLKTTAIQFPRMIVCEICGNKRCPHANDHENECTNSNEPGQKGSRYAAEESSEEKPCSQ